MHRKRFKSSINLVCKLDFTEKGCVELKPAAGARKRNSVLWEAENAYFSRLRRFFMHLKTIFHLCTYDFDQENLDFS